MAEEPTRRVEGLRSEGSDHTLREDHTDDHAPHHEEKKGVEDGGESGGPTRPASVPIWHDSLKKARFKIVVTWMLLGKLSEYDLINEADLGSPFPVQLHSDRSLPVLVRAVPGGGQHVFVERLRRRLR